MFLFLVCPGGPINAILTAYQIEQHKGPAVCLSPLGGSRQHHMPLSSGACLVSLLRLCMGVDVETDLPLDVAEEGLVLSYRGREFAVLF